MPFHMFDKNLQFLFGLCTKFVVRTLNIHIEAIFLYFSNILEYVQFENSGV